MNEGLNFLEINRNKKKYDFKIELPTINIRLVVLLIH